MKKKVNWIKVTTRLPEKEGYYKVKFQDGTTDQLPFRIRPNKNICGFMTEGNVIAWK
jgi:hypothetical protein